MRVEKDRILAKVADIREQIGALKSGEAVGGGAGVHGDLAATLEFQEWRRDTLEHFALNLDAGQVLQVARDVLQQFSRDWDARSRVSLDLCRFALGLESLEALLMMMEVTNAG